jgi:hypothetical protein
VHPTEIYDSLLNLALFAGLAWFYKRRKFDGQVFALYLVCYAVLRSFVEFFRGDYPVSRPGCRADHARATRQRRHAAGRGAAAFLLPKEKGGERSEIADSAAAKAKADEGG